MIKALKSVNIKKYLKAHEAYVIKALEEESDLNVLEKEHLKQIAFIQHERLIHLLVLFLSSLIFLSGVILSYIMDYLPVYFLTLVMAILEFSYLSHYFRLENSVQRWYILDQKIQSSKSKKDLL